MTLDHETPEAQGRATYETQPSIRVRADRILGPSRVLVALLGAVSVLALWWLLSLQSPAYLLPSPVEVTRTFLMLSSEGRLGADILETAATALGGLALAAVVAGLLAVAFVLFRPVESAVYPTVVALRSVPAVAAAPLLVIWIGTGILMKVVVAAFVSFFPILVYMLHGLRSPSQEYLDQFAVWGSSKWQLLLHLRLPWALPSFFSALRVAVTYALIGSFVAELMGSQRGLGRMIFSAYYHFDTSTVVVGILAFGILGLLLFGTAVWVERLVLKRIPVSALS